VHHLFFTKIPHYNLRRATDALENYMKENGLGHLYKKESTPDFWKKVFEYVYAYGTRALLLTKNVAWLHGVRNVKHAQA
jgi:fatty acid desaturase